MALLSATSPAKAHFSALLFCHDEPQQHQHQHALPGGGNRARQKRARGRCAAAPSMRPPDASVAPAPAAAAAAGEARRKKRPRVLVAGGGIGGLVLALAARRKGYDVTVFERDMSAVRGEGQYRGPIQIQSNALAALEAIDMSVAEEVMRVGCVTGDRINGLVDGMSGSWYAHPSPSRNLPSTTTSRVRIASSLALFSACAVLARAFASAALAAVRLVRTATATLVLVRSARACRAAKSIHTFLSLGMSCETSAPLPSADLATIAARGARAPRTRPRRKRERRAAHGGRAEPSRPARRHQTIELPASG